MALDKRSQIRFSNNCCMKHKKKVIFKKSRHKKIKVDKDEQSLSDLFLFEVKSLTHPAAASL